jgi:GT2 family glycosyltransferase
VPASIIVPFHTNLAHLDRCLSAVRRSMPLAEVIIAADGARQDCRDLASRCDARVIDVAGPSGPATARNRGAAAATGDVLLFVDADVVVAEDALPGMYALLGATPELAAVFGAYDLTPPEPNFMSQYKNLSHAWVHQRGAGDASTFWAGLGAIRTEVFAGVGGFDERFRRPSVEDIDLGCRITARGDTIRLDPRFTGTHLKRWTLRSSMATEILARGIPWTQLIHRYGPPRNQLNLTAELRLSVVLSYLLVLALLVAPLATWALAVAVAAGLALIVTNGVYYRWCAGRRGVRFAVKVFPAHVLHHLGNGLSYVAGTCLYAAARTGLRLPGALPLEAWRRSDVRGER